MKRCFSALLTVLLFLMTLLPAAAYTDVPNSHWAYFYISQASSKGWIQGTGNDRYDPSRPVTAAEFFMMTTAAVFPEELAAQPKNGSWYTPAWNTAQALGLNEGTVVQTEEQLNVPLSRQDMAQIVYHVLAQKGLPFPGGTGNTFSDWMSIPAAYRPAVSSVSALGILSGDENNVFAPQNALTRAEAAVVLCRMAEALYPIEVIRLVNVERAREGLSPVELDPVLMEAAQIRALETRENFSHTRPNGKPCSTVLEDIGVDPYSYIRYGENIASGFSTPESVMNGWMSSPGHRSNILTKAFTLVGIGHDGSRWVQLFGKKDTIP